MIVVVESDAAIDIRKPMFSMLARNGWPLIGAEASNVNLEDVFLTLINNSGATNVKKKRGSKKRSAN